MWKQKPVLWYYPVRAKENYNTIGTLEYNEIPQVFFMPHM
jgi:hypothetical protein